MAKKTSYADRIRRAIKADPRSLYRIGKDSGVAVSILQRFMAEERSVNLTTAEKVCRVIGFDLVKVGRSR